MKKVLHNKILLLIFLLTALSVQAKVKIFGTKSIEENSALFVQSSSIRNLSACLWVLDDNEHSSTCKKLFTRTSKDKKRAKIYLPSVDGDTQAKLVVKSGPYAADEQEFLISIKDVIDPRTAFLEQFKFFTKKTEAKPYSLSVKREEARNFTTRKKKKEPSENMYQAQQLTFQLKEKIRKRKEINSKPKRPGFRDLFRLKPRHAPPLSPRLGDIFVSDTNALCIFMDNQWLKIVGSGQCLPADIKKPVLPTPIPQPKASN
jgi:hypothetical protein